MVTECERPRKDASGVRRCLNHHSLPQGHLSQGLSLPSEQSSRKYMREMLQSWDCGEEQPPCLAFLHCIFFCDTLPSHSCGRLALVAFTAPGWSCGCCLVSEVQILHHEPEKASRVSRTLAKVISWVPPKMS